MTDREFQAHYIKWAVIENIAILATITICTSSVAYFANSDVGLLSLLLALALNVPILKWKRNKQPEDTAS